MSQNQTREPVSRITSPHMHRLRQTGSSPNLNSAALLGPGGRSPVACSLRRAHHGQGARCRMEGFPGENQQVAPSTHLDGESSGKRMRGRTSKLSRVVPGAKQQLPSRGSGQNNLRATPLSLNGPGPLQRQLLSQHATFRAQILRVAQSKSMIMLI
jgi:hypothetical protein